MDKYNQYDGFNSVILIYALLMYAWVCTFLKDLPYMICLLRNVFLKPETKKKKKRKENKCIPYTFFLLVVFFMTIESQKTVIPLFL